MKNILIKNILTLGSSETLSFTKAIMSNNKYALVCIIEEEEILNPKNKNVYIKKKYMKIP